MRNLAFAMAGAVLAVGAAACSDAANTATTTSRAETTAATVATTTLAVTTTRTVTTASAAATTTTIDRSKLASASPGAELLFSSILSAAELDATKPATIKQVVPGGPGPGPAAPVTGPLNFDGVLSLFPAASRSLYSDALRAGELKYGANVVVTSVLQDGTPGPILDIIAMKFASAETAAKFVEDATRVALQTGGARQTDVPSFRPDADNVLTGRIVRVATAPEANPSRETAVAGLLYPNGLLYLCAITSAPGTVDDATVLGFVKAQSSKYQALKEEFATLPND